MEESRQRKAAEGETSVKDEDPYGGSTDENTDAEAEEEHPIPELPGTSVSALISVASCLLFTSHTQEQIRPFASEISTADKKK